MPRSAADRLLDFVVAQSTEQPLKRRAQIYRDTAECIATESVAKKLRALADELDDFERRAGQMDLFS